MRVEAPVSSAEKFSFLDGFRPRMVDNVLIFDPGEGEMLTFDDKEGRVKPTSLGVKFLSPKPGFLAKEAFGWNLQVKTEEDKKRTILASYGGGVPSELIKNIFVIDEKLGRVSKLNFPGREILKLLELVNDNQPVFIPVLPSRTIKEGGVLVVSIQDLKKPQNQARIKGFLST